MKKTYASFFAVYKRSQELGNPLTRQEVVLEFTGGRTDSLRELKETELKQLVAQMQRNNGDTYQPKKDDKADQMRKAIIAIFRSMGRSVSEAKSWSEKQGVRGVKKGFNAYSTQELYVLITIAEKVRADYEKAVRKGLRAWSEKEDYEV